MKNYIHEYGTRKQKEDYEWIKEVRGGFKYTADVETAIDEFINAIADACREYHYASTPEQIIAGIFKALRIIYDPQKKTNNPHDCLDVLFDVRSMRAFDLDKMSAMEALDAISGTPLILRFSVETFEAKIERLGGRRIYRKNAASTK